MQKQPQNETFGLRSNKVLLDNYVKVYCLLEVRVKLSAIEINMKWIFKAIISGFQTETFFTLPLPLYLFPIIVVNWANRVCPR